MYSTKIKSIKKIGVVETYDLNTPKYHNFFLENEILSHNSGKSYRDLRKAELWYQFRFKKPFPPEHICFGIPSVMNLLSGDTLKRGDILIFEEAGVNLGSRDWNTKISKMFNYVLQSFRSLNLALFMNLPFLSMLDKQARSLLHYYGESIEIDEQTKKNICKPFFLETDQTTGKTYRHYPIIIRNGRKTKLRRFSWSMPSPYLADAYEEKKKNYLKTLTTNYHEATKPKEKSNIPPPIAFVAWKYLINGGLSQIEIAEKMKISQPSVSMYKRLVENYMKLHQNKEILTTSP